MATGHKIVQNTVHTEPLVTNTPDYSTPKFEPVMPPYIPPSPPPVNYGYQPEQPAAIFNETTIFKSHVQEEFQINPNRDMPFPLRKCKLCGHKGYGDDFKNHQCRR